MSEPLSIESDAVRTFAATQEGVAGQIAAAGDMDTVTHVAAMTPVFGVIGADYLAMFAAAQVLHAKDINELSGKVDNLGKHAFGTAAVIDDSDSSFSNLLGSLGNQIGG
ncbi:type VII secretion target [Nocardia mexicana]|uniref:Excreted virulence factor EspC (Type VII ESX diderm) n=1 Tax=Nocardia mexicana TaxID=279262 RepID=A0A370H8J3_9NOCA|nr:type VII secretion target [Nocardia mexicana]RDI50661.1 excreted virulence factor EspC (type VII ESX diderm) [Nocardia mexicana]